MASQIVETDMWRYLLKKIGENLRTEEVDGLTFLFDIPGKVAEGQLGPGSAEALPCQMHCII